MTNTELVRQLKTASVQADDMRLRDFGYLMKCAADALEQLEKESRKWELDAHANKLERDNYLKKSQELAAAWCDALDKVRVWIPVTERLPEPNTEVLIFSGGFVDIGGCEKFYDFDSDEVVRWYVKEVGFSAEVTHWMPLPNPPEKGMNE